MKSACHNTKTTNRKAFCVGEEVEPFPGGNWTTAEIKAILSDGIIELDNGLSVQSHEIRRVSDSSINKKIKEKR